MAAPSSRPRTHTRRLPRRQPGTASRAGGVAQSTLVRGEDTALVTPSPATQRRLANRLAECAPHDGPFQLRLPGTCAVRLSRVTTEATYSTLGPALCVAAQGAKVIMLGREVFEYDPAHLLVLAVDLPFAGQVVRASFKEPGLGFVLDLDPERIETLAAWVFPRGAPKVSDRRGLYVGRTTDDIVPP
jgi:hypothetical protein